MHSNEEWSEWPENLETVVEWIYRRSLLSPSAFDILTATIKDQKQQKEADHV